MENRDGLGVSGMDATNLLDGMYTVGFDPSKPDPIAVEINDMEEAYNFQVKLNKESKGKVPLMKKVDLIYLSLSASHTNVALRAVNAGVASDHEGFVKSRGRSLRLEEWFGKSFPVQ